MPDTSARILYCVLNWGLGHATRSAPVISALVSAGYTVEIASDGGPLEFLHRMFPACRSHELPGYHISYPTRFAFLNAVTQLKNMLQGVAAEQQEVQNLMTQHRYCAIISDNRYGCFHASVPSILVTHQLRNFARTPLLSKPGEWFVNRYLRRFNAIWIPDTPDRALSGKLTDVRSDNITFIGHLSDQVYDPQEERYDIAAILSGPEPQRTRLEQEILPQLLAHSGKCVLVRGIIQDDPPLQESNVSIHPYMHRADINALLNSTKMIICRSGYSSLMDLLKVGSRALLIPTPGQPEQIYLGERMKRHTQFWVQQQGTVKVETVWNKLPQSRAAPPEPSDDNLLQSALVELTKLTH